MIKIITSTDNKITIKGSRAIKLIKAVGINDLDFFKTKAQLIICQLSCDDSFERCSPISFMDFADNALMIKDATVADFSVSSAIIKNNYMKTVLEFKIPENTQFELSYEIVNFTNQLFFMKLKRDLDKVNCIKNNEDNKGLTWHANLLSINDSREVLNGLNNMHLFAGHSGEALHFYKSLISEGFNGEFKNSNMDWQNYKSVYIYSSESPS